MALNKAIEFNGGIANYHTPIIIQNNQKKTTVAISSWVNAEDYLAGKEPVISRWNPKPIDSKYPTAEEIYALIKKPNPTLWNEDMKKDDGTPLDEADFVSEELNDFVDAEEC